MLHGKTPARGAAKGGRRGAGGHWRCRAVGSVAIWALRSGLLGRLGGKWPDVPTGGVGPADCPPRAMDRETFARDVGRQRVVDVTARLAIDAPADRVAAFALDPANDRVWMGGIREAHHLTADGPRLGSRVARVARFMGRRIHYVLEITEYAPPARIVMTSRQAPFPMVVTYAFLRDGDRTQACIRLQGGPTGAARYFGPVMAFVAKRGIKGDLRRLRGKTEASRADADGA